MEYLKYLAITHVIAGVIALSTGPVAMITKKGGKTHNRYGKIYFYAMTYVFISAIALSTIKFIPFLFMISFISYYGCFSGVRILKMKKLHRDQRPKGYDWFAGLLTVVAGLLFLGYGIWLMTDGTAGALSWLSVFFGIFTVQTGASGLIHFVKKPSNGTYWFSYHISGMVGSYIAATTAFLVTIGRIVEFNHWILWVTPAIIGTPLISYWKRTYKTKFATA